MRAAVPGIKVLYTSGYAEETIGWGRLNDSSVEFIKKPFTSAELARACHFGGLSASSESFEGKGIEGMVDRVFRPHF